MRTVRLGWPRRLKAAGLTTPGTLASSALSCLDSRSSSARSGPNSLIEFSPLTPDTASSMLSWIYCEKLKSMPMNSFDSLAFICRTSSSLVSPLGHSLARFQRHEELGEERAVRIGAFVAAALLGGDGLHRRKLQDGPADAGDRLHAGLEIDGRRHHRPDPEVAFLELGQELGAEPRAENAGDHQKARSDRRGDPRIVDRQRQNALVDLAEPAHQEWSRPPGFSPAAEPRRAPA